MRLADAGVEHRDVLAGAVAAERVGLGRLDQRRAAGELRRDRDVLLQARGAAGALQLGERALRELERDVRDRLVALDDRVRRAADGGDDALPRRVDPAALRAAL